MALAVDLYHPTTGKHRRIVVNTANGDEAAAVASRMAPGLHVRAVVPAQDVGVPELRLPPGLAARYDGTPPPDAPFAVDDVGAGTLGGQGAVADPDVDDHPSGEIASPAPTPAKRGRGRPPGSKNKPKNPLAEAVQNAIYDTEREMLDEDEVERGPVVERPNTEGEPLNG